MREAEKYLQRNAVINISDTVGISLAKLMEYTKLVQLESLLTFVEDNHTESYGLINSIKFEIREILNNEQYENEDESSPLQY